MVPQWITYQADVPFAQKLRVRNTKHNMSIRNMTEARTMYFEFETAPNGPNAYRFYEGLSIRCTALKIAIKFLEQKERSLTV